VALHPTTAAEESGSCSIHGGHGPTVLRLVTLAAGDSRSNERPKENRRFYVTNHCKITRSTLAICATVCTGMTTFGRLELLSDTVHRRLGLTRIAAF